MTREQLLETLRLCAGETEIEACAKQCPLYGTKGDCISTLLNEAREEIIYLESLNNTSKALIDEMHSEVKKRREMATYWEKRFHEIEKELNKFGQSCGG